MSRTVEIKGLLTIHDFEEDHPLKTLNQLLEVENGKQLDLYNSTVSEPDNLIGNLTVTSVVIGNLVFALRDKP